MILRLIIAFTRWAWSVSPAFVTPEQPLSDEWCVGMFLGAIFDIVALVVAVAVVVGIVEWIKGRKK